MKILRLAVAVFSVVYLLGAGLHEMGSGLGPFPRSAVAAEPASWEPAGFGGAGNFLSVHIDPTRPGVVFAASDVAGVFRSEDFGNHWEMRSLGLGNYQVASVAIDPFDPDTLYAGVGAFPKSQKAGMYVSHDGGATWRHLPGTAENRITFRAHRTRTAIALDPANRGVIVSGSRDNGVWRSTDGGDNWAQVYEAPLTSAEWPLLVAANPVDDPRQAPFSAPVMAVAFDPAADGTVYAAFYGVGIVKSSAGGAVGTWRSVNNGLPDQATVVHLAAGPNRVLYAALSSAGIYKSEDGGDRWRPANAGLPLDDFGVISAAVHPTDPLIAYLSVRHARKPGRYHAAVWRTQDGGTSWTETGRIKFDPLSNPTVAWSYYPQNASHVVIDPIDPNRLYFVEAWGVYRSDNGGRHWQSIVAGAQNTCVTDLVVDFDHPLGQPDMLYATHLDAGLLSSPDDGATWQPLMPRDKGDMHEWAGHYWRMAVTRDRGEKQFYVALNPWSERANVVIGSKDGVRWRRLLTRPLPPGGRGLGRISLAIDPNPPSSIYLIQDGGQVLKSTDQGKTWAPTSGQPKGKRFNDLVVDNMGSIFVGTFSSGVWRSIDRGDSWRKVLGRGGIIWDIAVAGDSVFVAAGNGNLFRSRDRGDNWRKITDFDHGRDGDGTGVQGVAVAIDPADENHIVFSRADTWHFADPGPGLVESWDGGKSWNPLNRGLGVSRIFSLTFGREGTIFAGASCGGIWRLERRGG